MTVPTLMAISTNHSDDEVPAPAAPGGDDQLTARTRTGTVWWALAVVLILLIGLLVFVLQNTHRVRLRFLWVHFSAPAVVGLLLAAVAGALLVFLLGTARILQLRLAARRHRRRRH